jgi:hypothetical protein
MLPASTGGNALLREVAVVATAEHDRVRALRVLKVLVAPETSPALDKAWEWGIAESARFRVARHRKHRESWRSTASGAAQVPTAAPSVVLLRAQSLGGNVTPGAPERNWHNE